MNINKENVEELILLFIDKELNQTQSEELMLFLQKNPEYQSLLEEYKLAVLEDNDELFFDNKESLKKPVRLKFKPAKKQLWLAAACLLLVCITSFWLIFENKQSKIHQDTPNVIVKKFDKNESATAAPTDSALNSAVVITKPGLKVVHQNNKRKINSFTGNNMTPEVLPQQPVQEEKPAPVIVQQPVIKQDEPLRQMESTPVIQPQIANEEQQMPETIAKKANKEVNAKGVLGGLWRAGKKLAKSDRKAEILLTLDLNKRKDYLITFNF